MTFIAPDACLAAEPFRSLGRSVEARVETRNGRPTLLINGRPTLPQIYALAAQIGVRWTWEEAPRYNIEMFAQRGFRLFHVHAELKQMWTAPDKFDIDLIRRQIRGVLDVCPDAAVMVRLDVGAPVWWNESHPDECTRFADTEVVQNHLHPTQPNFIHDLEPSLRNSLASRAWLRDCGAKVGELCRRLAETPEGDALFAVHLVSGVYHEWHYWSFVRNEPDTSKAMTDRFRRWLRDRYGDDRALQAAWNDPNTTFDTATVPGVEPRMNNRAGFLRDPQREQRVIDYYRCQHQTVTDSFIHFCRAVKDNWPRPILAGGFHGYWFKMFGRMAAGGHLEVKRALDSPAVDYLAAPQSYGHLGRGQSGLSRTLVESCRLHGKLFIDEMDELPTLWKVNSRQTDAEKALAGDRLAESVALLRRNIMQSACRGVGVWYYELPTVHTHHPTKSSVGMWDHPALWPEIENMRSVSERYFRRPYRPAADVLLVYDDESFYYSGHNKKIDPVSTELLDGLAEELLHAGAAVDMIYLFDLDRVDLDRYKAVIFANVFKLDQRQRELVRAKVARNGRHLVWQSAPGYTDGEKLAPENVSAVVGIKLEPARASTAMVATESPRIEYGLSAPIEPLFVVADPEATPLGRLKDTDQVALARKSLGPSTAWFSSAPLNDRKVLRRILQQAGAHLYSDGYDVVYAGGDLLLVHVAEPGGKRTLSLRNGKKLELEPLVPSTLLLDAETGETLLP
ncbi:MAG: beta-galactosidase [Pirellulales bacterium]|nr:beta-galactosidase [Pirellulales bacterium]